MTDIDLTWDQQWIKRAGTNYGLRTVTHCGCKQAQHETLIIEGDSHDEEPWVSAGTYRCGACGIEGGWTSKEAAACVGSTGISTPGIIELDRELSNEWLQTRMIRCG